MIHRIDPASLGAVLRYEATRRDPERSLYWSDDWDPDFYVALARAGFISIAIHHPELGEVLIPELQESYAVLDWPNLHASRKLAKLMRSGRLEEAGIELRIAGSCERVMDRLLAHHGERCWIVPRMQRLFRDLEASPRPDGFSLRGVELWSRRRGELVAGELGYSLGRTYTSLSGFCRPDEPEWRHMGTLQMFLLAERLRDAGYAFWNLGHPEMAYKEAIGGRSAPRALFLERWVAAIDETPAGDPANDPP